MTDSSIPYVRSGGSQTDQEIKTITNSNSLSASLMRFVII